MPDSALPVPFSIASVLPLALRPWTGPWEPALHRLFIPNQLLSGLETARKAGPGARFARTLLESLDIRFAVEAGDLARVPAQGPVIVVANHPRGIAEGLILTVLLDRVRADAKILANSLLSSIPEMSERTILVNPFETRAARDENRAPLRSALGWLSHGGLLAMFPAGEVAHMDWTEHAVTDPVWKTTAARLALRSRCPVVPVFFEGFNSVGFQLAGMVHPGLRTAGLLREFQKMSGTTLRVRIGSPIPHCALAAYPDATQATAYLRSRTFFLANRAAPPAQARAAKTPVSGRAKAECAIAAEVEALSPECELASAGDFGVYLAQAPAIPHLLAEIGRCRELAFRMVGEGTGAESDLDSFDAYYQHLFLWSKADRRLAGAYRLAITSDVLPRRGISGLYTSTLFRYDRRLFERVGPAVELGRSFVMPEYQKNYASLLLLWKGITRVIQRRPDAPVLFGAVSISREYTPASRGLIASYLARHLSHELSGFVHPRNTFRDPIMRSGQIQKFAALAADLEDVSLSVADIEGDEKGIPVLLRQYLKAGGRVLGCNVDPRFSNAMDALLLVDLRDAPIALLERCMGRPEAREFLAGHGRVVPRK